MDKINPEVDEALEPLNPTKATSSDGVGAAEKDEDEDVVEVLLDSDSPAYMIRANEADIPDSEMGEKGDEDGGDDVPAEESDQGPTTTISRFEVEKVAPMELGLPNEEEPPPPQTPAKKNNHARFAVDVLEIEPVPDTHSNVPPDITIQVNDIKEPNGENSSGARDSLPLADHEESPYENHMALYEDDLHHGRISAILNRINNYQGGIMQNVTDMDTNATPKKRGTLGTIMGVFLPCVQNIFGVLLFVRLAWIVGTAGCLEAFLIVFICCSTTLLTSISMSAIATNGVVPAGGSYFMISRALGPEFGGAVGILFYLGTSVASSMYIIGAIEIFAVYMAPQVDQFGDIYNSFRLYGTVVLLLLVVIVFFGVALVSKFATVSLGCVILSIICIYIGIFISNPDNSIQVCLLGDRLLNLDSVTVNNTMMCNRSIGGPIHQHYCKLVNTSSGQYQCDNYFDSHEVRLLTAIPGLGSGVFVNNTKPHYGIQDKIITTNEAGDKSRGEIVADITTSFMVLIAIYFPSVTGIMAGSNRSGDLADAQKSIPIGTICAVLTTSSIYLSSVLFFAGSIEGDVLRDKFGESIGGSMLIGKIAWPHEWVILVGSFLSTLGAGLQSLTGAPRLLQAIAQDGVIPFLRAFRVTTKKGEPFRALLLTTFICFIGVSIGNIDHIAPLITMFFLMCYGFVNMACALQTLLRTPNWRPRFRFYHWTLSLIGLALCITLMFISSWYYALAAIAIAGCIYKYIEYKGAEQEWGDGIRGLAMSAARYSLLRLQEGPPHTKNWRPQLLVLLKCDENLQPKYPKMVEFANQLKAGKGLTLVHSVLEGNFSERYADAQAAKQTLSKLVKEMNVKGFSDVSVASNLTEGLCSLVQNAGLGGLRHNSVVMGWPYGWRHSDDERSYKVFLETIRNVSSAGLALLVMKGINQFPDPEVKLKGTIDVWWIVHDGGLLMLLPFLLTREKPWKHCKLRIFTVAQMEDNSITMKKDLEMYLYQLRIAADVDVIEMSKQDISAYTYERTLMMEQRTEMLRNMRLSKPQPQSIVDRYHPSGTSQDGDGSPQKTYLQLDRVPEESTTDDGQMVTHEQFTFTPVTGQKLKETLKKNKSSKPVDPKNVRRMHTAVRLNEHIVEKSHDAQLVILNLPAPPRSMSGDENYMEFLEVLTEGLERVLMVRGSGREVITIYS